MKSQLIKLVLVLAIIAGSAANAVAGSAPSTHRASQPNVRAAGFRPLSVTGKESAKRSAKKCYRIECDDSKSICFMFGDTGAGCEGRMSRWEIPCGSKLVSTGPVTLHNRMFAFDPNDAAQNVGMGCTNCEIQVATTTGGVGTVGNQAIMSIFDDSQEFTSFSTYQAAP